MSCDAALWDVGWRERLELTPGPANGSAQPPAPQTNLLLLFGKDALETLRHCECCWGGGGVRIRFGFIRCRLLRQETEQPVLIVIDGYATSRGCRLLRVDYWPSHPATPRPRGIPGRSARGSRDGISVHRPYGSHVVICSNAFRTIRTRISCITVSGTNYLQPSILPKS